jgi:TPR repeat protein
MYQVAIEWFTKAAANGHVHAKAQLALLQPYSRVIRREGLLSKKGAIVPSWKQRHFILDQSLISYAESKEQVSCNIIASYFVHDIQWFD